MQTPIFDKKNHVLKHSIIFNLITYTLEVYEPVLALAVYGLFVKTNHVWVTRVLRILWHKRSFKKGIQYEVQLCKRHMLEKHAKRDSRISQTKY